LPRKLVEIYPDFEVNLVSLTGACEPGFIPQIFNDFGEDIEGLIDVAFRGVLAQRKANRSKRA
jgi:hypothetical protein